MNKKILLLVAILIFITVKPVYAANKKISAYCTCEYVNGTLNCDENSCSEDILQKDLQLSCGKGNLISGSISYSCISNYGTKIGSSISDACKFDLAGDVNFVVTITATAECDGMVENVADAFCEEESVTRVFVFLGFLLFFAKLLIPFIIIVVAIFDYYQALTSGKSDELGNFAKIIGRRILTGIIIFLIPDIVNLGLNFVNNWRDVKPDYEKCATCILKPTSCLNTNN